MCGTSAWFLLLSATAGADPGQPVIVEAPAPAPTPWSVPFTPPAAYADASSWEGERGRFQSDRAFPRFIGPVTNPVLTKDPRSLTETRLLFVQNWTPDDHPVFGDGDFQAYGLQLRLALTERLTLIADKDGYAVLHPEGASTRDGWLNMAFGLKYALVRDVEQQFLWSTGFMYEPQFGEGDVFQSHGDGLFTVFTTVGKEFGEVNHALVNFGYQFPADRTDNSSFFYTQLHLDRQFFGWLYPLFEVNWFRYTAGGKRGIPSLVGEGDGLINLGTSGVAGNNLVTIAVGAKASLNQCLDIGIAYETPVSDREDLIDHRITFELILRY